MQLKNHSFKIEILIFSSILLLFILPPFFTPLLNNQTSIFIEWSFPFQQIIYGFIAAVIFFSLKTPYEKIKFLRFPVIFTVGLLLCSSLVIKAISVLIEKDSAEALVTVPHTFFQWVACVLTFLPAAFYEEVIYRFYLPDALILLVLRKTEKKVFIILCEILSCLIFAFSHYYMGYFSVLNAVFGHLILRLCFKKNGTIWPGVAAHFIYNMISLILL